MKLARHVRGGLIVAMALGFGSPLYAQRDLAQIPDPDPEVERRSFQVAEGFEVNLFAADPLLAKPLQMNFDASGRLWVACSEVYPQIQPGQAANDKVVILEDKDGDGKADATTVFADGLLIPTGIEPGDGGAYVANSTELLHLKDTNGDGKADRRRIVLSGFGTEDTHHILHTLRWGFDGNLYFNQSLYIHSHIETPYGVRRLGGGGIWRFRPETMALDVFVRGFVNPWGHHFDRWGQQFATDGAYGEGINYLIPGATYTYAPNATRVVKGLNPGSPKHCGAEVLSGRHLPEDWRGNILTNDFRGNRVCRFVVSDDGAGFASREQAELIKTSHVAFRPIDIKMGPDGAIYIADWYNPIIQHGEVDFRDPRRDHTRGRIWRVTARGRPLVERPKLVGAPIETLLDALKAPEDWTRHFARLELKGRGAAVAPALAAWVKGLDLADEDVDHRRLEALWTYQSLDLIEPDLLKTLLNANDPRARAGATRVVGAWHEHLPDPLGLLADRVADEHPRVRLEAVCALAQISGSRSAEVALRVLDRPLDRFLDDALWFTVRALEPEWFPALRAGRFDFGGKADRLVFALEAVGSPAVVGPLMESIRAGKVPKEEEAGVLGLIATLGGPDELSSVLDMTLADDSVAVARRSGVLASLEKASRRRKIRPAGDLTRIGRLLDVDDNDVRAEAARLAGLWGVEALRPKLTEFAEAEGTSEPLRGGAIDGLAALGGPADRAEIERLCGPDRPRPTRLMAIHALATLDLQAAARRAADLLAGEEKGADPSAILATFLQHQGGPAALVSALSDRRLPADVAKVGVRLARASGREEPALVEALTKAGQIVANPEPPTGPAMDRMVSDVGRLGDAARGEAIFRRKDQNCLKCHAIAGAGGQVGPDLASIGASAPADYLIDSLLQPNKAVKENYHSRVVATRDGKVITGIPVRQTDSELVLRDADDRDVAIPLDAIDEQAPGGSIMPAGLTDTLTEGELLDLVRFLSELGKAGSFAIGQDRLARRWQVLEPTPEATRALRSVGLNVAVRDDSRLRWAPAYSQVSGLLPVGDVPAISIGDAASFGFARTQVEVSTPGKFKISLNSSDGLRCWVDGNEVEPSEEMVLDLPTGPHTLTFGIDPARRREALRVRLDDFPGSAARAQAVLGR